MAPPSSVPAPARTAPRQETRLKLGIRPEHVGLAQDGELQGEIEAWSTWGRGPISTPVSRMEVRFVVQTAGDTSVREGDRLALVIRADAESPVRRVRERSLARTESDCEAPLGHHQAV